MDNSSISEATHLAQSTFINKDTVEKGSLLLFYSSILLLVFTLFFSKSHVQIICMASTALLGLSFVLCKRKYYIFSIYLINITVLGSITSIPYFLGSYDISIIVYLPLLVCNKLILRDSKHFWYLMILIMFASLINILFANSNDATNGFIIDGVVYFLSVYATVRFLFYAEIERAFLNKDKDEHVEFLRKIIDINPHSIYAKSKEGKFTYANKSFAKTLGKNQEEIIGKTDFELGFSKQNALANVSKDIAVMDSAETHENYIEEVDDEGYTCFYQSVRSPMTDKEGNITGILGLKIDRSEEKRNEKKLFASKLLYQTLFDNLNDGVVVYDYELEQIRTLNTAAYKIFGFDKSEDLNKYDRYDLFPEFVDGVSSKEILDTHKELILNSQTIKGKTLMKKASGELFECIISVYPSPSKNAEGIVVVKDISDLHRQEARYKFLFENAFDGIAVNDYENMKLLDYNAKFKELLNLGDDFDKSKYATLDYSPEFQDNGLSSEENFQKNYHRIKAEKTFNFDWKFQLKDGSFKYANIALIHNESSHEKLTYALYKETTNERLTQKALRESEKRFRLIFDNAFDGLYFFNYKTQKIILANNRLYELFETTADRILIDKPHLKPDFQPDGTSTLEKIKHALIETLEKGKSRSTRIYVKSDGTVVHLEISTFLLSPPDDDIIVSIYKDITDLKRADEALVMNATQQEKLDALSRELTSYTLFSTQKNKLLQELSEDLKVMSTLENGESKFMAEKVRRKIADNLDEKENWLSFKVQFERVHQGFFNKLEQKFGALSTNDLKHCAYIKMGLSNSEIADILYVGKKAVEMSHYRLKKKLNIEKDISLKQAMKDL